MNSEVKIAIIGYLKKCGICHTEKDLADFNFKNKVLQLRQSSCRDCTRIGIRLHYNKNREYYLAKAKKRNSRLRGQIRDYIREYLMSHSCVNCGENNPIVLEFDHIKDKLFTISSLARNHTLNDVQAEIEKCEVRCANCHRIKTAKQFGWYKNRLPL